jgi:hypothetical protein
MKSRGVYETPGGTLLLTARRAMESITLDRGEAHLKVGCRCGVWVAECGGAGAGVVCVQPLGACLPVLAPSGTHRTPVTHTYTHTPPPPPRPQDDLMPKYAELIYNGFWFSPEREAIQRLVDNTQQFVSGTVRLKLYKVPACVCLGCVYGGGGGGTC